jgi:hypothetical protein
MSFTDAVANKADVILLLEFLIGINALWKANVIARRVITRS